MREPMMKFFFEPRQDGDGGYDGQPESGGLVALPPEVLQRHGAVVLDPGTAAAVKPHSSPRPTVYRTKGLLIPAGLARNPHFLHEAAEVLARVGMGLVVPTADDRRDRGVPERLSVLAVLVPAADRVSPVVVDAWVALQALRGAASSGKYPALSEPTVRQITLDHLLIGSPVSGPAWGGGSLKGNTAGPGGADSYVFSGGDTRMPVAVLADAPERMTVGECASAYGRRPVVAVLDTGMRCHQWLDVKARPGGGYDTVDDGFVAVDHEMQKAIYIGGEIAEAAGDTPRQLIRHPWDTPVTADHLIGELDTDTGHGTFIAGIVRQVAPDAQVLAIRVMHSDGVAYESDVIDALGLLAERIALAEEGDPASTVDVVSLSLGFFSESPDDVVTSPLGQVIEELLRLGVTVVAAAGNFATYRRWFPAALAGLPTTPGQVPLISVGALNPNGSRAQFSDAGRWVTAWATGAVVTSTFPTDINGSRMPELEVTGQHARASLDPDDYSAGFAVWSGTSFSAPLLAAHVARALMTDATNAPGLRLDVPGPQAAAGRALAALTSMGWSG
jgi:subtilisin family serine protease